MQFTELYGKFRDTNIINGATVLQFTESFQETGAPILQLGILILLSWVVVMQPVFFFLQERLPKGAPDQSPPS